MRRRDQFLGVGSNAIGKACAEGILRIFQHSALRRNRSFAILQAAMPHSARFAFHIHSFFLSGKIQPSRSLNHWMRLELVFVPKLSINKAAAAVEFAKWEPSSDFPLRPTRNAVICSGASRKFIRRSSGTSHRSASHIDDARASFRLLPQLLAPFVRTSLQTHLPALWLLPELRGLLLTEINVQPPSRAAGASPALRSRQGPYSARILQKLRRRHLPRSADPVPAQNRQRIRTASPLRHPPTHAV